jgi:AcrR family transcriptional regulator
MQTTDDGRQPTVRQRLLAAAREVITLVGEEHLTLAQVVDRAGLTTGAVYSNFANREELIVAVHLDWFRSLVARQLRQLASLADPTLSDAELAAGIDDLLTGPDHAEARRSRWLRVRALAAADRYPALHDALRDTQRQITEHWIAVVSEAQRRCIIDPTLDSRAVALALELPAFGLVLADMAGPLAPDSTSWLGLIQRLFVSIEPTGAMPGAPGQAELGVGVNDR